MIVRFYTHRKDVCEMYSRWGLFKWFFRFCLFRWNFESGIFKAPCLITLAPIQRQWQRWTFFILADIPFNSYCSSQFQLTFCVPLEWVSAWSYLTWMLLYQVRQYMPLYLKLNVGLSRIFETREVTVFRLCLYSCSNERTCLYTLNTAPDTWKARISSVFPLPYVF